MDVLAVGVAFRASELQVGNDAADAVVDVVGDIAGTTGERWRRRHDLLGRVEEPVCHVII